MDIVRMIFLLIMFEVHAKDLNSTIYDERSNATIKFYMPVRNEITFLEINFCGYSNNQHFTNILVQFLKSKENGNTSINSNYTGRIERLENNNETISLLLINVMFNDSGNYTIVYNKGVNATTVVLVTRRTYMARNLEPTTFSFMAFVTNISIIRIDMYPTLISSQPLIFYNRTANSCVYTDITSMVKTKIQTCLLRNGEFSFYIQRIDWLHKGFYFAWDGKGRLLDSLSLNIQDVTTNAAAETPPVEQKETFHTYVLVVTILVVFLSIVSLGKLLVRAALKSRTYNFIPRNTNQITTRNSGNEIIPRETVNVIARNNLNDLPGLSGFVCAKSSSHKRSDLHLDSSLSCAEKCQSESTNGYDYAHEYDELSSGCQSNQKCDGPKLLDTESSTSQSSCDYSYVFKNRPTTNRPSAQEPVTQKKLKQSTIVANSFYSYVKSLPTQDQSIIYGKRNNKKVKHSHRTKSGNELSFDFFHTKFDQLKNVTAKKDVEFEQKCLNVQCLKSNLASRPESFCSQGSISGRACHCLKARCARDDYDHTYVMQRRSRRCWSSDDSCAGRITNTNVRLSRSFSATDMNEDYYDCLSN